MKHATAEREKLATLLSYIKRDNMGYWTYCSDYYEKVVPSEAFCNNQPNVQSHSERDPYHTLFRILLA
jgi:hypothetical protein